MDNNCFYFSRFSATPNGDGGERRTAQLYEAFSFLTPQLLVSPSKKYTGPKLLRWYLTGKSICRILNPFSMTKYWATGYKLAVSRHYATAYGWNSIIKKHKPNVLLVDDPIYFYPLISLAKKRGIKIVAFAHNIESLVPGQTSVKKELHLLTHEIKIFSLCDVVVTISPEDAYLLNNFNVETINFPYYPEKGILGQMIGIRQDRKKSNKSGILLMGTAGNNPTFLGMKDVIDFWSYSEVYKKLGPLIVAGFHTQKLEKFINTETTEFLGTLSNKRLLETLSSVKACICFQKKGSGALTKIPELLIADVPVLANLHAARGYHNLDGIFEFDSLDQLLQIPNPDILLGEAHAIITKPDPKVLQNGIKRILKIKEENTHSL